MNATATVTALPVKALGGVRMAFDRAFIFRSRDVGVIVYPDDSLGDRLGQVDWITEGIKTALQHCAEKLGNSDYAICFAWSDNADFMADVWIFSGSDTWGSGPLADVNVFRSGKPEHASGVGSGNSLLVLGLEESLRRQCPNIEAYLASPRPSLPTDLVLVGSASDQ